MITPALPRNFVTADKFLVLESWGLSSENYIGIVDKTEIILNCNKGTTSEFQLAKKQCSFLDIPKFLDISYAQMCLFFTLYRRVLFYTEVDNVSDSSVNCLEFVLLHEVCNLL